MKKIAISIGDLNGIGLQIALESHKKISKICNPIYMIDKQMLKQGASLLNIDIPKDFKTIKKFNKNFKIKQGLEDKNSGLYSYNSFIQGVNLAKNREVHALVTLPINKKSWELAGINYKGHTDTLRDIFQKDAIMMMGNKKLFVALFTEHIPYNQVPNFISKKSISKFLINLYKNLNLESQKVAVLGLNPHSGDNGVLGNDEVKISLGINLANKKIKQNIFTQPLVPDIAFTPQNRKKFKYFVAMYHDQGLIPLKTLYFNSAINISLNLPIIRVSVGHGTAFDIAYKNSKLNLKSYLNAIKMAFRL